MPRYQSVVYGAQAIARINKLPLSVVGARGFDKEFQEFNGLVDISLSLMRFGKSFTRFADQMLVLNCLSGFKTAFQVL